MGYGGFYFGGNHSYNINTFLSKHPQVRLMVQADSKDMAGTPGQLHQIGVSIAREE